MESNGDTESDAQPKLTFADLNIPSVSTQPKDTPIGKIQRCQDLKAREILFMSLMLGSVLLATGFTIYRMAVISRQSADFSFGILLLINAGFCIWFTIDGVLRERPSEIVMLCLATIIILFYIIFNFALGDKNSIKLARLIVASISCPGITVVGLYCARKYYLSNHLIFRTVGAFQDMQNLYKNLLYFQDLLKFDLQVGCSIIVLVLDGNDVEVHEIVILSLGGAFKIVWFILGYIVMSREIKIGAWVFLALSPVEIAYIIFKMYDVSTYIDTAKGLAAATIVCITAALIVRLLAIVTAVFVYRGFGKGLKQKLFMSPVEDGVGIVNQPTEQNSPSKF